MKTLELWECETQEQIARWLLENSEYYFDLAMEEAGEMLLSKEIDERTPEQQMIDTTKAM